MLFFLSFSHCDRYCFVFGFVVFVSTITVVFYACRFCYLEGTNARYVYTLETRSFFQNLDMSP